MQSTPPSTKVPAVQGAPITEKAFFTLVSQRDELKAQLKANTQRRNELSEQRAVLSAEGGRDHDLRIKAIDQRSAQIDRQIMDLDIAIANARSQPIVSDGAENQAALEQMAQAALDASVSVPPQLPGLSRDAERAIILGGLALSAVSVYAIWLGARRFFLKPSPKSFEGQAQRLEQLQQSVDVIALEVERMSESQRFVAKVLSEKFPALGVGVAEPVATAAKDPVRAKTS